MSKHKTPGMAMADLMADAQVLMEATADMTEDKVAKARKRLAAALEHGQAEGEALLDSSVDMAKDTAGDLHKFIAHAMARGLEMYGEVREKTVEKKDAADHVVREHPYQAIGIALVSGALIGYLASLRHCCKSN